MKHCCSKCGHEDEIGAKELARALGAIRTPKKEAAWKKNGERLKVMYANARKLSRGGASYNGSTPGFEPESVGSIPAAPASDLVHRGPVPETRLGIAPKGSFSKEDLKALIAGGANRDDEPDLSNTPHAPFDVNIEGEPHRVSTSGKKLWLFYLGPVGPTPVRQLRDGELEELWSKRIT